MHRHGYQGKKFGRERDQLKALFRSQMIALISHHSIETTLPKAKELRRKLEKLITKAKKGDLASRRLIIAKLDNIQAAAKLVDEIAPKLANRNSGYLRITRTRLRVGDSAKMAKIAFVDDLETSPSTSGDETSSAAKKAPSADAKKPATKEKK
jgi:large subunit ribosomal protein L17